MERASEVPLIRGSQLSDVPGNASEGSDFALMRVIVDWALEYLCEPHDDLGRDGPVCPFTRPSLARDAFWLTVNHATDLADPTVEAQVMTVAETFGTLPLSDRRDARYQTVLILFPDIDDPAPLDQLQRRLKSGFVRRGLMIGQFYAGCDEPGLWNRDFRPLRSPIPLLAIRHMVASDFPFLVGEQEWLTSYLTQFAPDVPPHVRQSIARLIRPSQT